ncbi:MAG TPA: hypothetical protein VNM37_07060 [Candidatus Dormibacteraeota bacterium]|nr:hypothetical protein [Candidatus Dormibacteraeota bacterium]
MGGPLHQRIIIHRSVSIGPQPDFFGARNIHAHFDELDRFSAAPIFFQGKIENRRRTGDLSRKLALSNLRFIEVIDGSKRQRSSLAHLRLAGTVLIFRWRAKWRHFLGTPFDTLPTDIIGADLPLQIIGLKQVEKMEDRGLRFRGLLLLMAARQEQANSQGASCA